MTSTYTRSLSSELSGSLNTSQLITEINSDNNILSECLCVVNLGDNVNIIFNGSLSTGEETTLDTIITNHTPNTNPIRGSNVFRAYPNIDKVYQTYFYQVATFEWPGINNLGEMTYIDVISRTQNSNTYDLRIINSDNGTKICERTNLSNLSFSSIDLGTLSNVPDDRSILELQIKSNTGKQVYIREILVYYQG